ncbi:hypothetical protein DXG01_004664 [Tephrocybe rancida]|nr:hypothetical protein DXG01_004664 [Tephrocybe rancida]
MSSIFAYWAPQLYQHYAKNTNTICDCHPQLKHNCLGSIFAATVFNLGPQTVCHHHKDFVNLTFGWCSITALGDFNPTKGGNIILWEFGLVIEFPPSYTLLIPSVCIEHGNVAIGGHKQRYSITQHTPGALFQWAEHGMKGNLEFLEGLAPEEVEAEALKNAAWWKFGLSLFSTFDEVKACRVPQK